MKNYSLSLLVLTEDSGKDAHQTISAITKKLLQLVVPNARTDRIHFEPANATAVAAMHANTWKSKKAPDRRKRVDLIRTIATKLAEETPSFVLFHYDGDRAWSQRETSENKRKFEDVIISAVRQLLSGLQKESRLDRLLPIVPFYSIEAWAYQNTQEAKRICQEHKLDPSILGAWESDRTLLDELEKPKNHPIGLGALHNLRLLQSGYPSSDVFEAERSLFETTMRLLRCDALSEALDQTWQRSS